MTLSEFKAWFEGYTDAIEGAPTKAQFDKIKVKVAAIDGSVTTYPIYVDRYRGVFKWPNWPYPYATYSENVAGASLLHIAAAGELDRYQAAVNQTVEFDPHAAMYALGKADAEGRAA